MTSQTPRSCPRCGAPQPEGLADAALCPACLMSQALGHPEDETLGREEGPQTVDPRRGPWPRELGDYRLLRQLGSGGMGHVYEAEHRVSGRRVALKCLAGRLDSAEMRQRFLREGRLAASVSHPHSLYVFGSEEIEGIPVISMEVAESGTLQDELTRRGPLPVTRAVDAILDVLSGLEAAQAVGVLHRDIKPSNCFLTAEGAVKVGDYGLSISSLAADDSYATKTGAVLGTPAFASPEQLRGDELDARSDIYSVGATLYTLLTGRAPFEGKNAVQVVANAVKLEPRKMEELRPGLPAELERIVLRCLAKDPTGRFADYETLRRALVRFSSHRAEPAPLKVRAAAGWLDFLLAFLVPYVALVIAVGSPRFHFGWLLERTPSSAVYYGLFFGFGMLYFTAAEGLWGGGFGKRLKGLRVVGPDGGRPGVVRAFVRILSPLVVIEAVRLPILFYGISARSFEELTVGQNLFYTAVTILAPWVAAADWTAKPSNGYATPWDMLSGTRVVFAPGRRPRPTFEATAPAAPSQVETVGPFRVDGELEPGTWLAATDLLLRRSVWLIKRDASGLGEARREVSRIGRPRWLQEVSSEGQVWDAYEATPGLPFRELCARQELPWSDLRNWLHDLACELWAARRDGTLPDELGLDHVWMTTDGRAQLLDRPWPVCEAPADIESMEDLAGIQRFLHRVAQIADGQTLPLHARPMLESLAHGRFEKLSFLVGSLQGLLDRPATLVRGVRGAALFMLPTYSLVMALVGSHESAASLGGLVNGALGSVFFFMLLAILAGCALGGLAAIPFRTTNGHALFRLAIIDASGRRASRRLLLARWLISWLPLALSLALCAWLQGGLASPWPRLWVAAWLIAAAGAAFSPHRGLHDRLAGTWVVRS